MGEGKRAMFLAGGTASTLSSHSEKGEGRIGRGLSLGQRRVRSGNAVDSERNCGARGCERRSLLRGPQSKKKILQLTRKLKLQ